MGAGQSSAKTGLGTAPLKTKDQERLELFSTIFMRLLKNTDILDIRALTRGPGSCGDYVILLAADLDKDFRRIKIDALDNGRSAVKEFLFARTKGVTTETPSDQVACRSLAVFYIRALQLVSALTMSIYTPPDLVSRIRNRVYQLELKRQKRNIPLSLEEKEERRIKRENWWSRFLTSSRSDISSLVNLNQYKYNKTNKTLIYTDPETNYEYRTLLQIFDIDTYNIDESLIREGSYWIVLYNPTNKEPIFRSLVNADRSGYLFATKPEAGEKQEEAVLFNKDWTTDLGEQITQQVPGKAPEPARNGTNRTRRGTYGYSRGNNFYGGGDRNYPNATRNDRGRPLNTTRRSPTAMNNVAVAAAALKKQEEDLALSPTTTLPRTFQESYKSMIRFILDIPTWTEAAPGSYRAVLLFIKPTMPAGQASSYICVDNWAEKPMRFVAPYASLEALYYNKDDGTANPENKAALKNLASDFKKIFQINAPPKAGERPGEPETFNDVYIPPINEAVKNTLCAKRTAQGEILLDQYGSSILESAQMAILESYKRHFETSFAILNELFKVESRPSEEPKVMFAEQFVRNPGSARGVLEEIIKKARGSIANHYIEVETIYSQAIQQLTKPR